MWTAPLPAVGAHGVTRPTRSNVPGIVPGTRIAPRWARVCACPYFPSPMGRGEKSRALARNARVLIDFCPLRKERDGSLTIESES